MDNDEPSIGDPLIAYQDDPETDQVHQPYTAGCQGWQAGLDGIPSSLNPYPEDSREYRWWQEGWEIAQQQDNEDDLE